MERSLNPEMIKQAEPEKNALAGYALRGLGCRTRSDFLTTLKTRHLNCALLFSSRAQGFLSNRAYPATV